MGDRYLNDPGRKAWAQLVDPALLVHPVVRASDPGSFLRAHVVPCIPPAPFRLVQQGLRDDLGLRLVARVRRSVLVQGSAHDQVDQQDLAVCFRARERPQVEHRDQQLGRDNGAAVSATRRAKKVQ